ncbi:hypothetical protein DFH27DRAFT_603638 [Peziza echinospora]|nr:hypothetical protein DFH27DRAFT_603638 [Peziza echinospora]
MQLADLLSDLATLRTLDPTDALALVTPSTTSTTTTSPGTATATATATPPTPSDRATTFLTLLRTSREQKLRLEGLRRKVGEAVRSAGISAGVGAGGEEGGMGGVEELDLGEEDSWGIAGAEGGRERRIVGGF